MNTNATRRADGVKAVAELDLLGTLSHLLRRSHFHAETIFAKQFSDYDITSRQLALMVAVAQNEGASQRKIGETIALDTNTISDMVRRMEKRGLVERSTSVDDARSVSVRLGAKGAEILAAIHSVNLDYQDRLSRELTVDEVATLKVLLRKMLSLIA